MGGGMGMRLKAGKCKDLYSKFSFSLSYWTCSPTGMRDWTGYFRRKSLIAPL